MVQNKRSCVWGTATSKPMIAYDMPIVAARHPLIIYFECWHGQNQQHCHRHRHGPWRVRSFKAPGGVGESHKSFVLLMLLILTLSDDHPSSDVQHVQTRIYRVIPFRVMPYRSLKGSRKWIHLKPAVNGSFHVPSGKPLLRRGLRGVAELGQLNAVDPGEEQIPHKRTT